MLNKYRIRRSLGMNRNTGESLLLEGQWKYIINADISKLGVLKKRDGYAKILNTPDASEILSLIPFEIGSTKRLIMINAAGKVYSARPGTDATWGSACLTGLSATERWGYTILHDSSGTGYMILGNGLTTYKTSDGVNFTSVSGAPLAKFFATMFERVYAAGVPASPDTLHWSSLGDLTDWSTVSPHDSSSTQIDTYSKGNIQGIRDSNDRIVAFKDRQIKRWDGEYLKTVRSSFGCEAPYSLAEIDGMILSFDREGIRLYDGNEPMTISDVIEDLIHGVSMASANLERICGEAFKNKYYLSVGDITDEDGETVSNAFIVYDYTRKFFWLYSTYHHMTAISRHVRSYDGDEKLYAGDVNGNVYEMFNGDQDDDKSIEMNAESHLFYPESEDRIIEPKRVIMRLKRADEMKVSLSADEGDPKMVGECKENIENIDIGRRFGNNVHGMKLFLNHSAKGNPEFHKFILHYETTGRPRKQ